MTMPLLELGGSGANLHLAVANGFPPDTYLPLFTELRNSFRIVSVLPRALWPDRQPPPADAGSWESLTDDLLAGWQEHQLTPLIAMGHSFGAVASLLAAVKQPRAVRALVLLDPTIYPRALMEGYAREQAAGRSPRLGLVDTALKRRGRFASHREAFEYWRGKELFRDWPDPALTRYVEAMLRPDEAGGWVLTWPPDWEAWYYRSFYPHTWDLVPQLDPAIPTLIVGGETSDTFGSSSLGELRKLLPRASFATIPGAGHLFPQSHPEATRAVLEPWLASIMREPEVSVS
jgi:pimeloyl-ACP methyl ester carboxylesterase